MINFSGSKETEENFVLRKDLITLRPIENATRLINLGKKSQKDWELLVIITPSRRFIGTLKVRLWGFQGRVDRGGGIRPGRA